MTIIKNYMEDVVGDNLDKVIKNSGGCGCDKCRMDIMAISLNSLPAKYIVTDKGQLYTRLNSLQQQFEVDVVSAITNAVMVVKNEPRHTKEDLDDFARKTKDLEKEQ